MRSEKHRGVFVREISVAEADEIYDVREVLDQLVGQRVAERATPAELADLGDGRRRDGRGDRDAGPEAPITRSTSRSTTCWSRSLATRA